jgi:hypothetical protein
MKTHSAILFSSIGPFIATRLGGIALAALTACGVPDAPDSSSGDQQIGAQSQAQRSTSGDEAGNATAVASNGTNVLWAWPEKVGQFNQVRLQFRDINGNAATSASFLTGGSTNKGDLTVASGANGKFLVAWEQQDPASRSIKGAVVQNLNGQLAVLSGIIPIASAPSSFLHPRAVFASNRSKFLVVFHNQSAANGLGEIDGRFIDAQGVPDSNTFVVASVAAARALDSTVNRLSEPEVAFAHTTGVAIVTMESFGFGFEHIFVATIPPGISFAQRPMLLDMFDSQGGKKAMDAARPVFNQSTNKFVVPMIDDLTSGGINMATLAPGCMTADPNTCQVNRSALNVVRPSANGNFRNVAAAPLGTGVMLTTAEESTLGAETLAHYFFNSSMQLVRTVSLGRSNQRAFGTNSTAELSSSRAVASHTLIDPLGNIHEFYITAPPSTYVTESNF